MTKKTGKKRTPTKNRPRRSNTRQYVLVGLLMIALIAWIFLPKAPPAAKRVVTSPTSKTVTKPNSKRENTDFQKEGSLSFLKSGGSLVKEIDIEVSTNDKERGQGLMYRQSMDDGQGMLFIFDKMEMQSFWMKNTYIPLDIIYVDSDFVVVSIAKNTQPLSQEGIVSEKPCQYVVEVPGGFSDAYGIVPGDKIDFVRD